MIDEQTADAYDALACASPQGSIYCQRWWLDAVAPDHWQILTVQRGDKLLAAWPLVMEEVDGCRNVVMPPLTQKLGILYAPTKMKYAEDLSRQHRLGKELIAQLPEFGSFFHRFHESFTNWLPFFWEKYVQQTAYTYIIENLHDTSKVWKEMRVSARNTVRKAQKKHLVVDDAIDLESFLDLNDRTYARQGKETPYPRDLVRRIDAACVKHADRLILVARDSEGRRHSAVYIVAHNRVAYYLLGGSDTALRSSGAGTLLLWEAIQRLGPTVDQLDMEGSMMPNVEPTCRALGARQHPQSIIHKHLDHPRGRRTLSTWSKRNSKPETEGKAKR
jgi:GNAT acetyltransferase-like protein